MYSANIYSLLIGYQKKKNINLEGCLALKLHPSNMDTLPLLA